MELDGFVKLNDARLKSATTEADVALKMADAATKYAQLGKIREEIIKARLENIAKALDIKWDAQAHSHLLKIRKQAQQRERLARNEARAVTLYANRINRLLTGSSWSGIRDAWIAFNFFLTRASTAAIVEVRKIPVGDEAFTASCWNTTSGAQPEQPDTKDVNELWQWARRHTYWPSGAAWDALAATLQALSDAATKEAAEMEAKIDAAHKEAIELSKLDWGRLSDGR